MALDPDIRTTIRSRTRTRRRLACHRHPKEPVTGFCALCLRDRLAGLDSSTDQLQLQTEHEKIISFPLSRRTRGHGGASSSGVVPELRRSKSVAVEKCEDLNGSSLDLRRKSCDVRASNRLFDLFGVDDAKIGGDGAVRVESKNLGFSSIAEPVLEITEDTDDSSEIKTSDDLFVRNEIDDDVEIGGEDLRTMKEHIEIELQNRKKNFWEAASVFSQKLRKWRQKHKEKRPSEVCNGGTDDNRSMFVQFKDPQTQIQSEAVDYGLGRGSCDTEPRFSIDVHHMSVEPRFSYDEHRASWDGYMIARTIPRLTPMLPTVDDIMLPPFNKGIAVDNRQVQRIKEEGSSSGASAQSNSESSASHTGSSSSSTKSSSFKTSVLEPKHITGQETKLVITERELKDWHLSAAVNDKTVKPAAADAPTSACTTVKNSNGHKKDIASRWRKVSNIWNHKYKRGNKNSECIQETGAPVIRNNEIGKVEKGNLSAKHVRNSSCVVSRNKTELHPSDQEGARHSMSDVDSGLLRLYLPPFRKSRKSVF